VYCDFHTAKTAAVYYSGPGGSARDFLPPGHREIICSYDQVTADS